MEWSPDTRTFIANALSPAKVVNVYLEEDSPHGKTATVIVPDDQLSLAIGKEGQNARLAAKLTGWRIDIKSVSEAAKEALRKAEGVPTIATEQKDLLALAEEILRRGEEARPTIEEMKVLERTIEAVEEAVAEAATPERMTLKELGLSTRVRRRLERAGITVVADLLERLAQGEEEMLTIPNFGPKSLAEVKEKLREKGFLPAEEERPAVQEAVEEEAPPEEAVAEEAVPKEAPGEEAKVEGAEELEPLEELIEEEIELKPRKKAQPEKRILVYDEELGKVVAKRRRKPSRRREEWEEEYND